MTKTSEEKILFTSSEISLMFVALRYQTLEQGQMGNPPVRLFHGKEQEVAVNCRKELMKGTNPENGKLSDTELTFGSMQKELLIKILDSMGRDFDSLEIKESVVEKLKK